MNWLIKLLGGYTAEIKYQHKRYDELQKLSRRQADNLLLEQRKLNDHVLISKKKLTEAHRTIEVIYKSYRSWADSQLPHERKTSRAILDRVITEAYNEAFPPKHPDSR